MTDTPTPDLTAPEQVERSEYLIRKQGLWYRPNERGYTTSAIQAGRYTLADAMKITYPNGPDGPRDGMEFYHESTLNDADWRAYAALSVKLEAAEAERNAALGALDSIATQAKIADDPEHHTLALCGEIARAEIARQKGGEG